MSSLIRPALLVGAALLLIGGASRYAGFAEADATPSEADGGATVTSAPPKRQKAGAENLILGSQDSARRRAWSSS